MSETVTLTADSQRKLDERVSHGIQAVKLVNNGADLTLPEEREMAARDAISDILTALWGAPGYWKMGQGVRPNAFALNEARRVVEEAFTSWEGDAEDYIIDPEPGEYGYEGSE